MGLLTSEEKEELKRLGFELNDHNEKVMKAILGRTPHGFWKDSENFKTAVEIATADLGCNTSEALRTKKDGKYRKVTKAFYKYNEELFGEKLSWKDGLEKLEIEYKPSRTKWEEGQLLEEASREEIKKAKKELEELKVEETERKLEVMIALDRDSPPSFFWANLQNFKTGVELATKDLGVNTVDAFQKRKEGRYNRIRRAFYKHREKLFGDEDVSWEEALDEMHLSYIRERETWSRKKLLRFIKENKIRSHSDLKEYTPAFSYYRRALEPKDIAVSELVEEAGLTPKKWTKKRMIKEFKKNKIKNWIKLKEESPELYEKCKRNKKLFYNLIDEAELELEYSPEELEELFRLFKISSEEKLEEKFPLEKKYYQENKENFKDVKFRRKKEPPKQRKKERKKQKRKTENERIVDEAVDTKSETFCPEHNSLYNVRRTIDGELYRYCDRCDKWYHIVK